MHFFSAPLYTKLSSTFEIPNKIYIAEKLHISVVRYSKRVAGIMALKINFTSLKNFVFYYISFRLLTEGIEEFLIQPTAWYYINFLGESNVFLGLTLAGYSAGALLFAPVVGVLEVKFDVSKILTVMCAAVRFVGNLLYSIPINGYFPMVGRFICGLGASTEGILFGVITKGTTSRNRAKAFLYLEGLYCLGTTCGPILGSVLTFKMDIFGWKINAGNSPGVVLMLIWFTLLMCALFLPNDLAENTGDGERSIIDSDNSSPSSKTTAEHDNGPPSSSSMIREENSAGGLGTALLDDDSDDGISLSKSLAWHGCPPSSMVFCMYYLICLSYFVYMVISFYVPLLAKYNLGLKLIHVKLIYLNSSLFSFVLFLATPLILENVCETTFLLPIQHCFF
ncbi:uncharacterized protein LOC114521552 [Dendronephthya gigantea]|uniref:uncharacterized protein LOC114521552 n=1 Tax=Dendronephthya gigantea TaxID=151771 RepID=UPI00106A0034|nr:uncharacterized protein LOC114521552 [Dendronephthya gigantea]